jgi:hypothetical protein
MTDSNFLNRVFTNQDGVDIPLKEVLAAVEIGNIEGINVFTTKFETEAHKAAELKKLRVVANLLQSTLNFVVERPEMVAQLRSMPPIPVVPNDIRSYIIKGIQLAVYDDPEKIKEQLQKEIVINQEKITILTDETFN